MERSRKPSFLLQLAYTLAALFGFVLGFNGGDQIGGTILGVVMGLNMAVICPVFVGMIAEKVPRRKKAAEPHRPGEPG
jgi:hypothetical protein